MISYKLAQWPAPENVIALTTTKVSGFSKPPFDSNNLALHVNDQESDVLKNRILLKETLQLKQDPVWLNQTHSTRCIIAENETNRDADASITRTPNLPLAILTADCLPITLCNQQGTEIAAIHAGWRGLFNGIIENTLSKMNSPIDSLMAWIGPSICGQCYEVGHEVYDSFTNKYPNTASAFTPSASKWTANLPLMAEIILHQEGIIPVFQSNLCTFEAKNEYFSYRRTPETGRIGTFIWLNEHFQD